MPLELIEEAVKASLDFLTAGICLSRLCARPVINRQLPVLLLAIALSPGWLVAQAAGPPAKPGSRTLHVRKLEDNRWIAWIDYASGRQRVEIPQKPRDIEQLAEEQGLEIVWYGLPRPRLDDQPVERPATVVPSAHKEWSPADQQAADIKAAEIKAGDDQPENDQRIHARPVKDLPEAQPAVSDTASASASASASQENTAGSQSPADPVNPSTAAPSTVPGLVPAQDTSGTMVVAANSAPTPPAPASAPSAAPKSDAPAEPARPLSDGEQLARLTRAIQADEQRLQELTNELNSPMSEFVKAEAAFLDFGNRLVETASQLETATKAQKQEDIDRLTADKTTLEKKRDLARQRLDLAIAAQRTLQEQLAAIKDKLQQEHQARARLTGMAAQPANPPAAAAIPAPAPVAAPALPESVAAPGPAVVTAAATTETPKTEPAPAVAAAAPAPATTVEPQATAQPPKAATNGDKALEKAEAQAAARVDAAVEAEQTAQSVIERLASLDKNIELEQRQFSMAQQRSQIAYEQQQMLEEEFQAKTIRGDIPRQELQELAERTKQARKDFFQARRQYRERTDRLQELQQQRTDLQAEQLAALNDAKEKRAAADNATLKVSSLKNPFSVHNMLQWLLDHGVKIVLILIGMLVLRITTSMITNRIVELMVQRGVRGTREERTDRANTLAGVFHNAASLSIVIGGLLMVCEEVGIAVAPLMGGAAVLGLAVAFGAQNLIRDYFYGFMILLENQYKLNDVLKIGTISGQVERITLRMTVLRDLEGAVHFIPNGKIDSVTNMTHGWSRALFDILVAYKEDLDTTMQILLDLAADLRQDPKFGPLITEDAEMLGVNSLDERGITIRFVIKTRPLKQWAVKRELLRRIKRRFDELGIEIPLPQRVIHHHEATAHGASLPDEAAGDWTLRKSA